MPARRNNASFEKNSAKTAAPKAAQRRAALDGYATAREISPLHSSIRESLRRYFENLGDEEISGIYRMVLDEVEPPLLAAVMERVDGNYSQAARILGLHRSTLCNKLRRYGMLP